MSRGSFRSGGGGGGSWASRDTRHQEYVRNAVAGKQPSSGGWWSSGSPLRYDGGDEEYYMSMPFHRCGSFKSSLEKFTQDGTKLPMSFVVFYHKYLPGCPDPPDFKKLTVNREDEDSKDKSFRCLVFTKAMDKALLDEKNELSASRIEFYKQWLDDCPNDSKLHDN